MKRIICFSIFLLVAFSVLAQNKYLHVNRNDGGFNQFLQSEIDSLKWSFWDWNEGFTDSWKSQIIYSKEREFIIPLAMTDNIQFNMPFKKTEKVLYHVEQLSENSDWDALMLMSNGYCSVIKTDVEGITTVALDHAYSKDFNHALVAQLTEDLRPISLLTDEMFVLFEYSGENKANVFINHQGEIINVEDVTLTDAASNVVTRRAGISENHYLGVLNKVFTYCNITKGVIEGTGRSITSATIDGVSSLSTSEFHLTPEIGTIFSLVGIGIGAIIAGTAGLPIAVAGTILAGANYIEEKQNQAKKEFYASCVGESQIETLKPQKIDNNTYKIGVKVMGTETIPTEFVNEDNEFGILLKKLSLSKPNWTLNLYDVDATLFYSAHLESDGEYYVELPVELGYKYLYCGYIVTFQENVNRKRSGLYSLIDSHSSYAYYGDKEEIIMDYSIIQDYRQTDVTYSDGVLIFEAEVDVEFSANEIKDASEYGVTLYRNNAPVNKDFAMEMGITKGSVKIIFEAEKNELSIDESNFTASTKDFWSIGTYKKNKYGLVTELSESKVPLDLIYDKKPAANTLKPVYQGTTSAMLECEFNDFMFWSGVVGIKYWKIDEEPIEQVLDIQMNGQQKVQLVDLERGASYQYQAVIRSGDKPIAEGTIEEFKTWEELVKLTNFVQTGASYKEKAFENEGILYSYKYDVAVTFELVDDLGVKDWGYKYIDLKGKIKDISLMGKTSPYTDSNYSYYRDEPKSWVTYQPYVEFVDGKQSVMKRSIGLENNEKEGIWYGDPVTFEINYDENPILTTGDAASITINSATLTGTVEGYDPADESIKFAFMYSNESNLANSSNGVTVPAQYDGNGNLTAEISGLNDYTTYYYALAIKRGDAAYETSGVKSFKTLPVVTTLDNATTTYNSATLQGTCSKGITTAGFAIKKDGDNESATYSASVDANGNFSATIDDLDANTTYKYYAFIQADGQTYNSTELSFTTNEIQLCPDDNHPHMIDLGLPSGTKWACCNLSASKPEDYGNYYAWGETMPKSNFTWQTYQYGRSAEDVDYIGSDIAGTSYDAAFVALGDDYQTPSMELCRELINSTESKWVTTNGVQGRVFTGTNGAYIFLPAVGCRIREEIRYVGESGHYWTSTYHNTEPRLARGMTVSTNGASYQAGGGRFNGHPVRPVLPGITVKTYDATEINTTSAILNGTVKNYAKSKENVKLAFVYSTSEDILNSADGKTIVVYHTGDGNMSVDISDLTDYTTYYYAAAYKLGNADYVLGEVKSFKTLPVVTTLGDPSVTVNSATLQGSCSKGIMTTGFAIKKDGNSESTTFSASADANGNFSTTIDGLDANTTYKYYAFIQADGQTYNGTELSFTTDEIQLCPDDNHPHMIDLGLPSGTKWACCNVGASKPEEYGGYYSWGEVSEKSYYGYEEYQTNEAIAEDESWRGKSIHNTSKDVAHVNWYSPWHIPTLQQMNELINNCDCEGYYVYKGVVGAIYKGRNNNNSIFMPYSGRRTENLLVNEKEMGWYWTSQHTENYLSAYFLHLYLNTIHQTGIYDGLNVRAVVD